MSVPPVYVGATPNHAGAADVRGDFVRLGSEPFYRITAHDHMPPFFMSLVSASDHWMFISSNGGLTAGRRNADHALFPYYAEDRIHDGAGHTGPITVVRLVEGDRRLLWEPLAQRGVEPYAVSRNLYKSVVGDALVFEEINHDLEVAFRYRWTTSDRFGFVRRAELENLGSKAVRLEVLDGLRNLLPAGIQEAFQARFSVLGDAYKQNELDPTTGLATYALSSYPGDSPEPAEALRATVCWSPLPADEPRLLSVRQVDRVRRGEEPTVEDRVCGRRGAYLVDRRLTLDPGERSDWILVADVDCGPVEIARVRRLLAGADRGRAAVLDDVQASSAHLVRIVAGADGLQATGDRLASAHHFANVLFNVMRGGVFEGGYRYDAGHLAQHVWEGNREVWSRHRDLFDDLGEAPHRREVLDAVVERGDPDLHRLVAEYLPLSFSRRHGDPSRPWNRFSIEVRDEEGGRALGYEGNWRDIFQNWEALCRSFPDYLEGVVTRFVDTTTADGHNPYRITDAGYEWERPAPDEPWAHFGYWGDHQLIYLLKLLEASRDHHPDRLERMLREPRFVYADVPYDIRPYEALLEDPKNSIVYNREREAAIADRVARVGRDGHFLTDPDGRLLRANLTEKLLVPLLAKLATFVPGAGFWMNTQRPEWNDANNALAGYGASMVTLYHARRYVAFCRRLFEGLGDEAIGLHVEVADWLLETGAVLAAHRDLTGSAGMDDADRRRVLDGLGDAASTYRTGLYDRGLSGRVRPVEPAALRSLLELTLAHLDHSIALNRRDDGLYHAYNILEFPAGRVGVRRLQPMLEGQVAVLSSGALDPEAAVEVLKALRESAMYRADQHSYMLYPDRRLPGFLEKNVLTDAQVERSDLLRTLLAAGDRRLVERDVDGRVHFAGALRNARDVEATLALLADEGHAPLVEREREAVLNTFEEVFDHHLFTGRSGTFYGYEGLGCIYWHMVGKLLLAVQECALAAEGRADGTFDELRARYFDVRSGLGFNRAPDVFGAFPTDPYSHTPGTAGAKQPGMTGQVKEEILTRAVELGLRVDRGRIRFDAALLRDDEFLDAPASLRSFDVAGAEERIELDAGEFGYTYCQVPVVCRRAEPAGVRLLMADGSWRALAGTTLDAATSAEIWQRSGRVRRIEVAVSPRS